MKKLPILLLALALAPSAPLRAEPGTPIHLSLELQRQGEPLAASQLQLTAGRTTPVIDAGPDVGFQVTAVPSEDGVLLSFRFLVPDGFGGQSVVRPRLLTRPDQRARIAWQSPIGVEYQAIAVVGQPAPPRLGINR